MTAAATAPRAARASATARRQPLLLELRELASAAARIDLGADPDATVVAAGRLRDLLSRTIALLAAVQAVDDDPAADLPELADDAWGGGDADGRAHRLVGDVCFAGGLELRRVLRELDAARAPDDAAIAGEAARRKLRRGVRAVLESAREAGDPDILGGEHQGHHQVADLAPALAVRRLYATFRRALRAPVDASPEAVLMAVRYAGGGLAALLTSPDYGEVRAADRIVLRRLRERVLTWARERGSLTEGHRLLADVATTADLLRGINRRQELRAHDLALIAQLAAGPTDDVTGWLARLEALFGLDDELDRLAAAARTTTTPERHVPGLLARLAHLP